jgi:mannosyltransferase OCH1-like enzyme
MAIPKKIHYCWFGYGQMPELAVQCLSSWKKHLPDYELILWNEYNFDINSNYYVKEAYETKKYAFVTDYVRLYALYHFGGIYMDTDVEVLKPLDCFLKHRAFTGCENENLCVTGIIASEKNHPWIKKLLDDYKDKHFILADGKLSLTTNTQRITKITVGEYGWLPENRQQILKDGLYIYPFDFFCAKDYKTGKLEATNNTYTIHHFSGSWHSNKDKLKAKIIKILGPEITKIIVKYKNKARGL